MIDNIFNTTEEMWDEITVHISKLLRSNTATLNIAVSGGSTPNELFKRLSDHHSKDIKWNLINIWWVDERLVPHNSGENNYANAIAQGINKLKANLFPVNTSLSHEAAAKDYELTMMTKFGTKIPKFDLILLGAGNDGHTASLFKGSTQKIDSSQNILATIHPETLQKRISMNYNIILNSKNLWLILKGEEKRKVIEIMTSEDLQFPISYIAHFQPKMQVFRDFH